MILDKDFNFSYWELKTFFQKHDLIIVGSGIVGLSSAISYKDRFPKSKVLILERGFLPNGASTKNAGFACFGSAGEILTDLQTSSETSVWETVQMRFTGLQQLRARLKDKHIKYQALGGYELFMTEKTLETTCLNLKYLNSQFKLISGRPNCYSKLSQAKLSQFNGIKGGIYNAYEGQLDTSLLMKNLLQLAHKKGVLVLNQVTVLEHKETSHCVELHTNYGVFSSEKVLIATNGFANQLLRVKDVKPARAQVLITKPIPHLKIKGSFHFDEGYYYFRNIDQRILFGGGRNLDAKTETTTEQGLNEYIQEKLSSYLKEVILPNTAYDIEHRWSGIMGIGKEKKPIIQSYGKKTLIAVRMGGMGIAIGTWVGNKVVSLLD